MLAAAEICVWELVEGRVRHVRYTYCRIGVWRIHRDIYDGRGRGEGEGGSRRGEREGGREYLRQI